MATQSSRSLRRTLTWGRHPRLATTPLTEPGALPALARERSLPRPPENWRPWFWLAALALHALVIALFLISFRHRPPEETQGPPSVSVVFDKGGAPKAVAPPAQIHGPPLLAETPAPAAPPPPESLQPEVRLDMPDMPLTALPTPLPTPQPQPQAQARPAPQHQHTMQKYAVMNDLSLGHPTPPIPNARRGLNLDLAQSDQDAMNGPEVSIRGNAGADWGAALDKWVEAHKYYPDAAAEQGQQGNVRITFTVDRQGNVSHLHMVSGSGSPFLDQAWSGLFEGAQLPPFPADARDNSVTVDATMHFMLLH